MNLSQAVEKINDTSTTLTAIKTKVMQIGTLLEVTKENDDTLIDYLDKIIETLSPSVSEPNQEES